MSNHRQDFRAYISLDGNFQIDTIRSSKEHIIFYHKKRNYRTFYIVSDQQEPPIGDVVVVRTTKKIVEQTVIDKLENKHKQGLWSVLCNNVVTVATSTKVAIENGIEELVRLPIDGQLFGTIPVLRQSSLVRLGQQLSEDECYKLGVKLNISEEKLSNIDSKLDFKTAMFEIWRPPRPNETLVFNLVIALKKIRMGNEADAVQKAFVDNVEFNPDC
ncbi:hypothetical protein AM593_00416, partial [Mytilus galloprovincialis]